MSEILTKGVYSNRWGINEIELRRQINNWISGAIKRQSGIEWRGGHDEGRFASSWGIFYKLSGDESIRHFLLWLRDSYKKWCDKHYFHGFQEGPGDHCNHSFENAEDFITYLYDMDPKDAVNAAIIEDIAHHAGNWVEGIPEWYDWENHRFVSHWLGTKVVRNYRPYDFELAGHTRIGIIVLYAYKITNNPRYLEWCADYAGKWADIIKKSEGRIPMVTYPQELPSEERMRIYNFDRERVGDPYVGNLWAFSTMYAVKFLLKVYEYVNNPEYLKAARKAIQLYEGILDENRFIDLCLEYQDTAKENIYQDKLMQWCGRKIAPALNEEQMIPNCLVVTKKQGRSFGFNDGRGNVRIYKGPTPAMFLNAYKILGDIEYLNRAMSVVTEELFLLTYSTRDGREHGCASNKFIHGCGEEAIAVIEHATGINHVNYYNHEGSFGLDEEIAVLCQYQNNLFTFYFYNNSESKDKAVRIELKNTEARVKNVTNGIIAVNQTGTDVVETVIQPKQINKVEVEVEQG